MIKACNYKQSLDAVSPLKHNSLFSNYAQSRPKFGKKSKSKNKSKENIKVINNDINRNSAINIIMSKSKLYKNHESTMKVSHKDSGQLLDYFLILDFEATCDNQTDLNPKVGPENYVT